MPVLTLAPIFADARLSCEVLSLLVNGAPMFAIELLATPLDTSGLEEPKQAGDEREEADPVIF